MHILFVSGAYKGATRMGGPAVSIAAAAEALVRAGHAVTVAATNANLDADLDVPLNQPIDVDGVTAWFSQTQRAFDRAVVDAHTGRPGSYCPLCADDGPCDRA